jgi:hypothetical protein
MFDIPEARIPRDSTDDDEWCSCITHFTPRLAKYGNIIIKPKKILNMEQPQKKAEEAEHVHTPDEKEKIESILIKI